MLTRYFPSAFGALLMTFALFLGMYLLIKPPQMVKPELPMHRPVIIGEVEPAAPPRQKIRKPDIIDNTTEIIDFPPPTTTTEKPTVTIGSSFPLTPPGTGIVAPKMIGLAEGDMQPITKLAPRYPNGPQTKGIEGYVVVRFTVTRTGSVENVEIVESTHSAFERPSLQAVEKYKYKPRVLNGVAVDVLGVMEKVTFQLEEG
ncbi:energy transducer TonB [Paremcibacter congregatus]|uniref:Protein TonB n=1 Tax=Paremcibacter congregatus TaxID=2043170 RepID=A0A2G4YTE0_9PROT|nr:energy transducer TonB [Paremcibacter congregatus]PHZ85520.1 hypothetical protein CRD36_02150 [Paremcibacter congregatus]QDE26478.1 TonB family protein [Paremcibacter congregatus]